MVLWTGGQKRWLINSASGNGDDSMRSIGSIGGLVSCTEDKEPASSMRMVLATLDKHRGQN